MKKFENIVVVEGNQNGFNYGYVIHKDRTKQTSYKEYFHDNPDKNICRINGSIKSCEHCSYKVDSSFCRYPFGRITEKEIKEILKNNHYIVNNDIIINKNNSQ